MKLKKFGLAFIALGLFVGNTDLGTGLVIWFSPEGTSIWKIFLMVAVLANIQACIWYGLGRELVSVLKEFYASARKLFQNPVLSWFPKGISRFVLSILRPFHEWDKTKRDMELLVDSILVSKSRILKTFLIWLLLPGVRSITAIIFGMNSWSGGLWLLIFVNTLHVALEFGFWRLLFKALFEAGHFLGI